MFVLLVLVCLCASTLEQAYGIMPFGMQSAMQGMRGMQGRQGMCGGPGFGSCYGTSYNPMRKSFCCEGHPYSCPSPAGWACCGKLLVQTEHTLCCNKKPVYKGPNSACCDSRAIDMTMFMCCDGEIQPKMGPNSYCCRKRSYDLNYQVCCYKDIFPREATGYNMACTPGNNAPHLLPTASAMSEASSASAPATVNYGYNNQGHNTHSSHGYAPPPPTHHFSQGFPGSRPSPSASAPQPNFQTAPQQTSGSMNAPSAGQKQQTSPASGFQVDALKRLLSGAFNPTMG